ncbi:MAG TPA: Nif3-like dinuclear metal center hexameric protein [Acidimicrobiia bacterium]|nr:Nif3-like dinuclear metal center hexameric protein [Acidimicrobiia bacterium]
MPTIAETLVALSRQAPADKAASWDQHGLQIGDPGQIVDRIGVCHEITEQVATRAISARIGLLITYHPLLFRPVTSLIAGRGPGGRAYRLTREGVAVAAIHTAWDAAPGGTADSLAAALELEEVTAFGPMSGEGHIKLVTFVPAEQVEEVAGALTAAGAGHIGNYSSCTFRSEGIGTFVPAEGAHPATGAVGALSAEKEIRLEVIATRSLEARLVRALRASHPYEEPPFDVYDVRANAGLAGRVGALSDPTSLQDLAAFVENRLGAIPRVAAGKDHPVQTVAVVPGSGASMIASAADTGAEVYLTGDVSHHQAVQALDLGIAIIDAGHAATERPGVANLAVEVSKLGLETVDLNDDPTPWSPT